MLFLANIEPSKTSKIFVGTPPSNTPAGRVSDSITLFVFESLSHYLVTIVVLAENVKKPYLDPWPTRF